MSVLDDVFYGVSDKFRWFPDTEVWRDKCKNGEYWASSAELKVQNNPDGKIHGDCDDWCALVRDGLTAKGILSRLVLCQVPEQGLHLVVDVDGIILDCRQQMPVSRDDLNYQFLSISGHHAGEPWHLIVKD